MNDTSHNQKHAKGGWNHTKTWDHIGRYDTVMNMQGKDWIASHQHKMILCTGCWTWQHELFVSVPCLSLQVPVPIHVSVVLSHLLSSCLMSWFTDPISSPFLCFPVVLVSLSLSLSLSLHVCVCCLPALVEFTLILLIFNMDCAIIGFPAAFWSLSICSWDLQWETR